MGFSAYLFHHYPVAKNSILIYQTPQKSQILALLYPIKHFINRPNWAIINHFYLNLRAKQ